MQDYIWENYKIWSEDLFFDIETRNELKNIKNNLEEIEDRFCKFLDVGTGGLRGVIGAGTNRINIYTVALITEALARFIETEGDNAKQRGVCISYDSRYKSYDFALITALVLANHGINSYLYKTLHSTPQLSYALRKMNCIAGVMITASHNPAKYNGYKFYGEDGAQMPPVNANKLIAFCKEIGDIRTLSWMSEEEARNSNLLKDVPESVDASYFKMLEGLSLNKDIVKKHHNLKIVYTPLHGAGYIPVTEALANLGFSNVKTVSEQALPDPNFSTVVYPNPEEESALKMAMDLATEEKAELILATDPDSDRLAAAIAVPEGGYRILSGNQMGILLMDYILETKAAKKILSDKSFVATTIVSTRLVHQIAAAYNVKLFEVLTGFKYIGELIKKYDDTGELDYQFGFEESYGYLIGTDVRDKDAVAAAAIFAELTAVAKENNENLAQRLERIYKKYSYAAERTVYIDLEGLEGIRKINSALDSLRDMKDAAFPSLKIKAIRDYQKGERLDCDSLKIEKLLLPVSNVLLYELNGMNWVCVRPSGTEPKLKIYAGSYHKDQKICEADLAFNAAVFEEKIRSLL